MRGGSLHSEVQIWRRNSTTGDVFTKVGFSALTPNATSDANVHEYYPDPPLEFKEGDILGVYTPRRGQSELIVYYQEDTGPLNYGNVVNTPLSTFDLSGPNGFNDYPLVTVVIKEGKAKL